MTVAPDLFDPRRFVRLDKADAPRPSKRQVALVPGAQVAVMALDLPTGLQGAVREKVARRQVADMLGQPAEALDVRPFHGSGSGRGWTRVLVAGADTVETWGQKAGRRCRAVLPDFLGLPTTEGLWTIAGTDDAVLARLGPEDGFSAVPGLADAMLQRIWQDTAETDRPRAILLLGAPSVADWAGTTGVPVVSDPAALGSVGVSTPKVLGHGELNFDLRRDAQVARDRLRARVLPWRWPVLIGMIAAGLWAAGQMLATQRLDEQRRDMMAATTAQVREHFVPQGPILDIRTQVTRELERRQAGRGGGDAPSHMTPLDLFGLAAEILAARQVRVGMVSYGPVEGLEMTVTAKDFAELDGLVEALNGADLAVTVVQSRAVEDGAEARLKLHSATRQGGQP